MIKLQKPSDRRQFGRRWTQAHGWICVEGRPKLSCVVQNFSETGALLEVATPTKMPRQFILAIDTIKFRMGCEIMRELPGAIGVKFKPVTELVDTVVVEKPVLSTYEQLLALANADHDQQESAEYMRNVKRGVGV